MHEASLIRGLVRKIETVAKQNGAKSVRSVKVKLGPLAHCSPEHFMEHFVEESKGTIAEGIEVEIEELSEDALESLVLESVELEQDEASV